MNNSAEERQPADYVWLAKHDAKMREALRLVTCDAGRRSALDVLDGLLRLLNDGVEP